MTWRDDEAALNADIEEAWGEPIRVLPWRPNDGGPDFSRHPVNTVGVMKFPQEMTAPEASGFRIRMVTTDTSLEISPSKLPYAVQQGDRVQLLAPERVNTLYELFEVGDVAPRVGDLQVLKVLRVPPSR